MRVEPLEARDCPSGSFLFVADYDKHSVRRYDSTTGAFVDVFVPNHGGGLHEPNFLVLGPQDGNLYVGSGHFNPSDHRSGVLRFDGTTGAFVDQFTEGGRVDSTHGVVFGPDGNLYVGDWVGGFIDRLGGSIHRFDGTTGEFLGDFVPTGSGGLVHPFGMAFAPRPGDPDTFDLYVGDAGHFDHPGNVLRYDGTTGAFLGEFVSGHSGGLGLPNGLTFGPDGNLYLASNSAFDSGGPDAVLRYQGPGGTSPGAFMDVFVAPGNGGFLAPTALIFGPDGNGDGHQDLYAASSKLTGQGADQARLGTVKRYDGVTGAFIDTFIASGSGGLDNPSGLFFTETDPMTLAYTGGAKLVAASIAPDPVNEMLSADQVQPLLNEAVARLRLSGADVFALAGIDIRIADLGGTTLGQAVGNTIWLDDNAAGWGWFVDATPWDDAEFSLPGDQGEEGRMDLLTTLEHELGHLLGIDHGDDGVMLDTLATGVRRMPGSMDFTDWPRLVEALASDRLNKQRS